MYLLGALLSLSLLAWASSEENLLELQSTTEGSENTTESILDWEAPAYIKKQFPYYLSGVDYENRPVVVLEWGKWNPSKITEEGGEDLLILRKYADQMMERMRTSFYKQALNDPEAKDDLAVLIDFDGLDLNQARSPATVKFFIEMSERVERVYHLFEYGFVVNGKKL
ncbi:unnamed protein product [Allacma fusca]|uniref:CRAL-TRIO domain-containing protein n=1 Tax=Allacma fusca TaxID=39272 RepID=A0A8J2K7U2_9HEXA|nr:unnamed protein product [Allacma fusca]